MKVTFRDLIDTVTPLIAKSIPSLRLLKTYLRRSFREIEPQLDIAGSFDDVMAIMEKKNTIINICCLEAIVEHYNIEEAKHHISAYKSIVQKFLQEVKLTVCENETFMVGSFSLLKCETVEFILKRDPDEFFVGQIRDLLIMAFNEIAKRVQVRVIRINNSVIVTCYAPRHIMDVLLTEAKKNLEPLRRMGLIKLSFGYYTAWDGNKVKDE